jgi:hypothetical protein
MLAAATVSKYVMFLTHNHPFLNFDHVVDIDGLLAIKPYISAFIAKNHHLLKPTKYRSDVNLHKRPGVTDYLNQFKANPGIITDPKLREIVTDLLNCDQFGNYIVFEQDVVAGTFSIIPRYSLDYNTKHHAAECVALSEDQQLAFFYEWLDRQAIFSDYGRVTLFINYPGTSGPLHHDYPDASKPNQDEFVLINFSPSKKKFYLIDNDTDARVYPSGYCNWFNTSNIHGSDPAEQACYSLRVDGLFSDAFKQRALT